MPIMVCVLGRNGDYVTTTAMWGQPAGYNEPDWWSAEYVLACGDPLRDLPELRASLGPIFPVCWKPWPAAKKRALK